MLGPLLLLVLPETVDDELPSVPVLLLVLPAAGVDAEFVPWRMSYGPLMDPPPAASRTLRTTRRNAVEGVAMEEVCDMEDWKALQVTRAMYRRHSCDDATDADDADEEEEEDEDEDDDVLFLFRLPCVSPTCERFDEDMLIAIPLAPMKEEGLVNPA